MNVLLDAWATTMWRACWQGGLVVLVIWSICQLLPSLPARFQCWLWRLAILKFMVALLVPWFLTVPLLPVHRAPEPIAEATAVLPAIEVHEIHQEPLNGTSALSTPEPAAMRVATSTTPSPVSILLAILFLAWIIGVGWSLLRLLTAWRDARRLLRNCQVVEDTSLVEHLASQSQAFRIRRLPEMRVVPGLGSPMLVGILRPVILMPTDTLGQLDSLELTMVFGHELAHARRADLLWGLVASLVRVVFFFHPLVWLGEQQLKLTHEVAADELAIAKQQHDPVSYASLLVSVIGKFGPTRLLPRVSVETVGSMETLQTRLTAIRFIGQMSGRVVIVSAIVLAGVVFIGLVPWRLVAAEPKAAGKVSVQYERIFGMSSSGRFKLDPILSKLATGKLELEIKPKQEKVGVQPATAGSPKVTSEPTADEATAIAEIEKLGGKVTVDERSQGKPVISVDLGRRTVTDAALTYLEWLTQLQTLDLRNSQVTDSGLKNLKGLNHLVVLDLMGTKVTDAGLAHLKGLPQLQTLHLCGTKVTDAGMDHLKGLPKLYMLDLQETQVTDAGLKLLKEMPQLRNVDLWGTKITDAGLVHLKGLPLLHTLALGRTNVTDAGLEHLEDLTQLQELGLPENMTAAGLVHIKGLTGLQTLFLGQTKISDAGLVHLEGLTALRVLNLERTRITDAGLGHLKGLKSLCDLSLLGTQVSDAGLEQIQDLTELRALDLRHTQVTDAGLRHLKGLFQLEWLYLDSTKVTDNGLEYLNGLNQPQLSFLGLSYTKVTDAGLTQVTGWNQLRRLCLWDTQVTDDGVKKLQRALPECQIKR